MIKRIEQVRKLLPANFGAAIISNQYNRFYLTGYNSCAGHLVIFEDDAVFLVDSRYLEAAKKNITEYLVIEETNVIKQIFELLCSRKIRRCFVEDSLSLRSFEKFSKAFSGIEIDTSSTLTLAVMSCREIKDAEEIQNIVKAQAVADEAFLQFLPHIKKGMSEDEAKRLLEADIRRLGADDIAFKTIFVSGENGSLPHGEAGHRRIKEGDLVTIDFGAEYHGYTCDTTRTVAIGDISEEKRNVYELVKTAGSAALCALKAGVCSFDIDKVARDIIDNSIYKGMFLHALGHSLGLEVHEEPRLSPKTKTTLMPGMVVTVEPGIYLAGRFGVRIEDTCIILPTGCKVLSQITKELIVIRGE